MRLAQFAINATSSYARRSAAALLTCTLMTVTVVAVGLYHVYLDRTNLPNLEALVHFRLENSHELMGKVSTFEQTARKLAC